MEVDKLLRDGRKIWGQEKLTLEEIIIRLGVVTGDISRAARDRQEGRPTEEAELKKEFGNIILSMIRWCDDLGYNPEECIELARRAQLAYVERERRQAGHDAS